ncbi:epimerase [Mucilaginibacter koreensis]
MKIKVIITGATGMVGEGVLHECLQHPDVDQVLIVNRKPYGGNHPKLKELIVPDLFNLSSIVNQLSGYNACFFCAGVTSVGKKEDEYRHLTYDLTLNFAKAVVQQNPDMVFCYVSGVGTDSTEKGSSMWARVKGKTENDLLKLPFKKVYNFRPGFIKATPGLKNVLPLYKYIGWLFPVLQLLSPNLASTLAEVGLAMINVLQKGYSSSTIEVKDIKQLAKSGL